MEMIKRREEDVFAVYMMMGEGSQKTIKYSVIFPDGMSRLVESFTAPAELTPEPGPGVTGAGTGARASGGRARGASPSSSTVP